MPLLRKIFAPRPTIQFERKPKEIPLEVDPRFEVLREKYVCFCKSPVMSEDQARKDFWAVCDSPGIAMIGFSENERELLIATEHVYLHSKILNTPRDIGEFIVHIERNPARITFENLTPLVVPAIKPEHTTLFNHPHIDASGQICMDTGKNQMYLAVGEGDMLTAVEYIWTALNTVGSVPYGSAKLDAWPIAENLDDPRYKTSR